MADDNWRPGGNQIIQRNRVKWEEMDLDKQSSDENYV